VEQLRRVPPASTAVEISGSRFTGTGVRCTDGTSRITLSPFRGAQGVANLEGNIVLRNGDATYSELPGTLKGNVAISNTGYGIYAPRATDLGGNIAFRNGPEPQCTGAVCARR
jgi:hypothetical protein